MMSARREAGVPRQTAETEPQVTAKVVQPP